MILSKQEGKYRIKFIQEHHYNKFEQKRFGEAKDTLGLSYKAIYNNVRNGKTYMFMTEIQMSRLARAVAKAGISFASVAQTMSDFTSSINRIQ